MGIRTIEEIRRLSFSELTDAEVVQLLLDEKRKKVPSELLIETCKHVLRVWGKKSSYPEVGVYKHDTRS